MLQPTQFQYEENEKEYYFSFQNEITKETMQAIRDKQESFWYGKYMKNHTNFIIPIFSSESETKILKRICDWYNNGKPERTFEPLEPTATTVSSLLQRITHKEGKFTFSSALRIQSYIDEPSTERWEDIHYLVVNGQDTLWQLFVQRDPTFPKKGRTYDLQGNVIEEWEKIPSTTQLTRLIHDSLEKKKVG